jgi:chemotaxis protein MotB
MHLRASLRIALALLALALLAAGCQKYKDQIASQKTEIDKLNAGLANLDQERATLEEVVANLTADKQGLEAKLQELEAKIASLGGYIADLEANVQKLGGDKVAMSKNYQDTLAEQQRLIEEMKRKQAAAQARLDTMKGLLGKFKALIAGGKLNVRIRNGKLMLELPSAVLFELGKYEVSEGGLATLGEVAKVLAEIKDREFQVAGHTDDVPVTTKSLVDNWNLSALRAVAVVRALQGMGVAPKSLSAAGYSEFSPAVPNDTKEHQAENRRIEIIMMPNLNELPDMTELEKELK